MERAARTAAEITIFDELQCIVDGHKKCRKESFPLDIRLTPISTFDAEAGQHIRRLFSNLKANIRESDNLVAEWLKLVGDSFSFRLFVSYVSFEILKLNEFEIGTSKHIRIEDS